MVRHEDARCQWMRVPPEKLSVHLGSYLDSRERETFRLKLRGQKSAIGGLQTDGP